MKPVAILMAVLALAAGCDDDSPTQPSNTGPIVFSAQLSALNEVPPVANAESGGRGTATIAFVVPRDSSGAITGGGTVTFGIQLNGFPANTPVNLAHILPGAQGVNGGVLVNTGLTAGAPLMLTNGTGNLSITANISQADATSIAAAPANFYFNVHTTLNPSPGAARGSWSGSKRTRFAVRGLAGPGLVARASALSQTSGWLEAVSQLLSVARGAHPHARDPPPARWSFSSTGWLLAFCQHLLVAAGPHPHATSGPPARLLLTSAGWSGAVCQHSLSVRGDPTPAVAADYDSVRVLHTWQPAGGRSCARGWGPARN